MDFGQVEKGKTTEAEFTVENTGDETLIIKGLFAECECVKANISSKRILPKQKTKLKINYDTKINPTGSDSKGIYIISNDPQTPKVRITVSIDITEEGKTVLSQEEKEIYAKVRCCPCGKSFTECMCQHAKEMKPYIKELLAKGMSKEGVLLQLAKKYSLDVIIDEKTKKNVEKMLIQEAGGSRPQIFIQPLSYDLGKIKKSKGKFIFKVKLQNKGNAPLEINKLKASCVCVTVKLKNKDIESSSFGSEGSPLGWKTVVSAGETAELIIVLDLAHPSVHIGKLIRSVEVRSNDPVRSLVKIELEAEIIK